MKREDRKKIFTSHVLEHYSVFIARADRMHET